MQRHHTAKFVCQCRNEKYKLTGLRLSQLCWWWLSICFVKRPCGSDYSEDGDSKRFRNLCSYVQKEWIYYTRRSSKEGKTRQIRHICKRESQM